MDLPPGIQALDAMYEIYWLQSRLLEYESFYDFYFQGIQTKLVVFQKQTQMCEVCFYKGLRARIYRTWSSLITQIHAGYVAESVFGLGSVEMSTELDRQGIDFRVKYKGVYLNYQIKKVTFRAEGRARIGSRVKNEGEDIDLFYQVPSRKVLLQPRKLNGDFRAEYLRFIEDGRLDLLSNGFVKFNQSVFLSKKQMLDQNSLGSC